MLIQISKILPVQKCNVVNKIQLYDTVIVPIASQYSCLAWTMSGNHENKPLVFEMVALRRVHEVSHGDIKICRHLTKNGS